MARDCVLLAGTCVSFLVTLDPSLEQMTTTCLELYKLSGRYRTIDTLL